MPSNISNPNSFISLTAAPLSSFVFFLSDHYEKSINKTLHKYVQDHNTLSKSSFPASLPTNAADFPFCLPNLKCQSLGLWNRSTIPYFQSQIALSLVYKVWDRISIFVDWVSKPLIWNPKLIGVRSNPQGFFVLYQNRWHTWLFYSTIIVILSLEVKRRVL